MLKDFSFEEVDKIAQNIEGWLDVHEPRLLYNCAKDLRGDGVIVEIGSWCAKSLTYITSGAIEGGFKNKIYSIDPFLTSKDEPNGKYETFITNLKKTGLFEKIIHIKEKSQIVGKSFNEKIGFLFIDGFHKYEAVKEDFKLFYPKVIDGGFVAIHDVAYYKGPTDLIKELVNEKTFKMLTFCDSILLARKVSQLSHEDELQNIKIIDAINTKLKMENITPII